MTTTRHQIPVERTGSFNGMDWEASYTITFTFTPGRPADLGTWPPTPAEDPELQFVSIDPPAGDCGAFTDLAQADLIDWAKNWLDEHFDRATDLAERERSQAPRTEEDRNQEEASQNGTDRDEDRLQGFR